MIFSIYPGFLLVTSTKINFCAEIVKKCGCFIDPPMDISPFKCYYIDTDGLNCFSVVPRL